MKSGSPLAALGQPLAARRSQRVEHPGRSRQNTYRLKSTARDGVDGSNGRGQMKVVMNRARRRDLSQTVQGTLLGYCTRYLESVGDLDERDDAVTHVLWRGKRLGKK